jgi:hypothetical protein
MPQHLVLKQQQERFCRSSRARIHITPSKCSLLEKLDLVKRPSSTFSITVHGTVQALGGGFGKEGLEHFRQFNDILLENARSIYMESKTNAATHYNVEVGELKVGIIDTPGFGGSCGLQQDELNVKRIIDVLKKEEYINCVCLIINGRQPLCKCFFKVCSY